MAIIQFYQNAVASDVVLIDRLTPEEFKRVINRLHFECENSLLNKAERDDDYFAVIDMRITPHITVANNQMFIVVTGVLIHQYDEKGG